MGYSIEVFQEVVLRTQGATEERQEEPKEHRGVAVAARGSEARKHVAVLKRMGHERSFCSKLTEPHPTGYMIHDTLLRT